jgi:hypothetical protein
MRELGYTDEQIAELRSRGVIHWEEVRAALRAMTADLRLP